VRALDISERYRVALAELEARGRVSGHAVLTLSAKELPWVDTALDLTAGTEVSLLATGQCTTMPGFGRGAGAKFYLWRRIVPDGEVAKGTRDTTSFVAERSGRLEVGILHGEWSSPTGDLATPPELYGLADGEIQVAIIVWAEGVDAARGLDMLRSLVGESDLLVATELERLAHPVKRPEGWSYLWLLGESDTFASSTNDGVPTIACCTRTDAAILRRPISLPTSSDARLSWRWRIDQLPSSLREDELNQHDYLSIAVEWDSGKDITYFWSSSLPVGNVFTCPIPQWAPRETHVVVRSGTEGLGQWCEESRDLYRDYVEILKAKPGRIVAVWLIAVSLFQHGEGRAEIGPIHIDADGRSYDIV
jgi:hypothetical protein